MKNLMLIVGIIVVGITLLVQSGVLSAALVFLLTGAIPSTIYSISPTIMLVITITSLWLIIAAASQHWARKHTTGNATQRIHQAVSLPRRRYSKAS